MARGLRVAAANAQPSVTPMIPMEEGPLYFTQDLYLYQCIRCVAMLSMAQDPRVTDRLLYRSKGVDEMLLGGEGVVRFEMPGEVVSYIVVKNGVKYTSETKPEWVRDNEIVVHKVPAEPPGQLLQGLKEMSHAMLQVNPEAHEVLDVGRLVEKIEACFRRHEHRDTEVEETVGRIVGDILRTDTGDRKTSLPIIERSRDCFNRVVREFMIFGITGEVAKAPTGTLMFFGLHPKPEVLYEELSEFVKGANAAASSVGKPSTFVPPMRIGFYLTSRGSLIVARRAARFLRQQGKNHLRSAISVVSVVEFYESLFRALLMYLAALVIYSELLRVGDLEPGRWVDAGLDREEIRRYWVETEEARVSILASLAKVYTPGISGGGPLRPTDFCGHVAAYFEATDFDRCEQMILELSVALICPEFLRDLALGLLAALSGRSLDRWRRRVGDIIAELERDLRDWVLRGEPNYLHYAYEVGAALNRRGGLDGEATTLEQKRDELPNRVDEIVMSAA